MSNKKKTRRGRQPPSMGPAMRAMADQSEAAHGQMRDMLAATAAAMGGGSRHQLGRIGYGIWQQMIEAMPVPCEHLSPSAPAPAFWVPWAPGRLMCAPCSAAASKEISGTEEDRRCDWCGTVADGIFIHAGSTPAGVVDIGGTMVQVPPVMLQFGLCGTCHAADAEPFTPPDAGPGSERERAAKVAASMAAAHGLKPGATVEGLADAVLTMMRGADARWLTDSRPVAAGQGDPAVPLPRSNAVAAIAAVIRAREHWVLAAAPDLASAVMLALARFGGITAYIDGAMETVLTASGADAVTALAALLGTAPFPVIAVVTVPKKAATALAMAGALGEDVPDGPDVLLIGENRMPQLLADAIDLPLM